MGERSPSDGWDDPPGTGLVFVVDELEFARAGTGFDVDGRCLSQGHCVDNALAALRRLWFNDFVRQVILAGDLILLVEVAGLDHPSEIVDDASLTVKLYEGFDADVPLFPANNLSTPSYETSCCEHLLQEESLEGSPPTARARIRGRADAGVVRAIERAQTGLFGRLPGLDFFNFRDDHVYRAALRRAQISFGLQVSECGAVTALVDGMLGGVIDARDLAAASNPFCRPLSGLCVRRLPDESTLELLLGVVGPPDIDGDGDGLEAFHMDSTGAITACIDGDGSPIPPLLEGDPASCALDPRVADGYSAAYKFHAVPATVVGVRPAT